MIKIVLFFACLKAVLKLHNAVRIIGINKQNNIKHTKTHPLIYKNQGAKFYIGLV
jgi:hypothetical protein